MKLQELLDDPTIIHVRRKKWANPREHLVLPPVVAVLPDGKAERGFWAKLYGYDGNEAGTYKYEEMPVGLFVDDVLDDWEVHPRKLRRGIYYRHKTYGKVLLIGSHPHDGAYLIVEQQDEANDEHTLRSCESSDLFEEIHDELAEKFYVQNNPQG